MSTTTSHKPRPARGVHREQVPLRYIHTMLKVVEAQGYDADRVLGSLPQGRELHTLLAASPADLEQMVDGQLYSRIYHRVMDLLQDESFGLGLRQRTPSGSFRMLALFIIHCETLDQALRRASEFIVFCRSLSDMPSTVVKPTKRLGNGVAIYRFPTEQEWAAADDNDRQRHYAVAHTMEVWRRFCQWLIGKPLELLCVNLQAEAAGDQAYFQKLFGCEIHYGCDENALLFAEHFLDCPLAQTEDSLRRFLRNAAYHLYVSAEDDDGSLLAQMKRLVGNDLSQEFPSVVSMAEHLNMSVRTLRRRLKEQGTTYQEFKDGLRKEHAMRWLNQPELKINAISALLGFDEPSAFHRSFKKWTGMTPGEYRESQQAPAQPAPLSL